MNRNEYRNNRDYETRKDGPYRGNIDRSGGYKRHDQPQYSPQNIPHRPPLKRTQDDSYQRHYQDNPFQHNNKKIMKIISG